MDVVELGADLAPKMLFDLAGRVRNLSLPATASNSLIPLFEAVSNAFHAVEERWQGETANKGHITVHVHRRDDDEDGHVVGFTIRDNGIGLNHKNWESFCTSDSDYKIHRGGKGIGRLSWLKTFSHCSIISRFEEAAGVSERRFSFTLKDRNPIQDHSLVSRAMQVFPGTTVVLKPFVVAFEAACPKKTVP
jgi:hypothetical protein